MSTKIPFTLEKVNWHYLKFIYYFWHLIHIYLFRTSAPRHFFFTGMLFVYGRLLSQRLVNIMTSDTFLYWLASSLFKYQMAICYFLYISGWLHRQYFDLSHNGYEELHIEHLFDTSSFYLKHCLHFMSVAPFINLSHSVLIFDTPLYGLLLFSSIVLLFLWLFCGCW